VSEIVAVVGIKHSFGETSTLSAACAGSMGHGRPVIAAKSVPCRRCSPTATPMSCTTDSSRPPSNSTVRASVAEAVAASRSAAPVRKSNRPRISRIG